MNIAPPVNKIRAISTNFRGIPTLNILDKALPRAARILPDKLFFFMSFLLFR